MRAATASYLDLKHSSYKPIKIEGGRKVAGFLKPFRVKRVYDLMGGVGVFADVLLEALPSVKEYVFNDLDKRCADLYKGKRSHSLFKSGHRNVLLTFTNKDAYEIRLTKFFDVVLFDHNCFTLNKRKELAGLEAFLDRNQNKFRFLMLTDSFYYSLKFLPDERARTRAWGAYKAKLRRYFKTGWGLSCLFCVVLGDRNCACFVFGSTTSEGHLVDGLM